MRLIVIALTVLGTAATISGVAQASDEPKRSPELRVLERFAGMWKSTAKFKTREHTGTETAIVTRSWSRGGKGNFMMEEVTAQAGDRDLHGMWTYDPNSAEYRVTFMGRKFALMINGTWDEKTETMTWRGLQHDGSTQTGRHRFIDDDHAEWSAVVTNPNGAVLWEGSSRQTRIAKTALQVKKTSAQIVNEIVAKHLEAIGQGEAHKKLNTPEPEGTITTIWEPTLKLAFTQKTPSLSHIRIDVPSLGVIMEYPRQSPNWLENLFHDQADVPRIVGVSGGRRYMNVPSSMLLFGRESQFGDAGLELLKGLTSLESLELSQTKVTDAGMEHLKGLTNLEELNIDSTWVTDAGLEHLKELTNLERLSLRNSQVTDAGLEHLKGLPRLKSLVLGSKITDVGLEHLKGLTSLEELDLIGSQVTGEGFKHLTGLTNLHRLSLYGTQVTGEGFMHLKGLTSLESLDLSGPQITDASLERLKLLTNLERLDINQTQITRGGAKKLRQALPNCMIVH